MPLVAALETPAVVLISEDREVVGNMALLVLQDYEARGVTSGETA
jgi:hypothetical protein